MVAVKPSEYNYQFRYLWDKHAQTFGNHINYRVNRRRAEHMHQQDHFNWDENEWWDSDSVISAGARPQSGVPVFKYKHDKFNQVYNEKWKKPQSPVQILHESHNLGKESDRVSIVKTPDSTNCDKTTQVYEKAKTVRPSIEKNEKLEDKTRNGQIPWASKPKHPSKAVTKTTSQSPKRPRSAPVEGNRKKAVKEEKRLSHPKLVAYGRENRQINVGDKKTYNIRASAEVFPSVWRAHLRQKADIEYREKLAKDAASYEKRHKSLFNDCRKISNWNTEYSTSFAGYRDQDYQRVFQSRLHPDKNRDELLLPVKLDSSQ